MTPNERILLEQTLPQFNDRGEQRQDILNLLRAADTGNIVQIDQYIDKGVPIDSHIYTWEIMPGEANFSRYACVSAIMIAARNNDVLTMNALLARGANVDLRNDFEISLHSPRTRCSRPEPHTAVLMAAELGHADIVNLLLNHGAKLEDTNNSNERWTILHILAQMPVEKTCETHERILNMVVQANHPNAQIDQLGIIKSARQPVFTPLEYAAYNGNLRIVKSLLEAGANINGRRDGITSSISATHPDTRLISPLNRAIQGRLGTNVDVAMYLIKAGASTNDLDDEDRFPLQYICSRFKDDWLELLSSILRSPTDVNSRTKRWPVAIILLLSSWKLRVAKHHTIGVLLALAALISHGADVNRQDEDGNTALHWAVMIPSEASEVIESDNTKNKLAESKTDNIGASDLAAIQMNSTDSNVPNASSTSDDGSFHTAPSHAGEMNSDLGNDYTLISQDPSHVGETAVVEFLVERGADPIICNNEGKNPLDVCHWIGKPDVAETLRRLMPSAD